jgi:hypothetical protein
MPFILSYDQLVLNMIAFASSALLVYTLATIFSTHMGSKKTGTTRQMARDACLITANQSA